METEEKISPFWPLTVTIAFGCITGWLWPTTQLLRDLCKGVDLISLQLVLFLTVGLWVLMAFLCRRYYKTMRRYERDESKVQTIKQEAETQRKQREKEHSAALLRDAHRQEELINERRELLRKINGLEKAGPTAFLIRDALKLEERLTWHQLVHMKRGLGDFDSPLSALQPPLDDESRLYKWRFQQDLIEHANLANSITPDHPGEAAKINKAIGDRTITCDGLLVLLRDHRRTLNAYAASLTEPASATILPTKHT